MGAKANRTLAYILNEGVKVLEILSGVSGVRGVLVDGEDDHLRTSKCSSICNCL